MTPETEELAGRGERLFAAYWLVALIAIAACVNIAGVGAYHLNADEVLYKQMAQGQGLSEVVRFSLNETHPPLYQILLHYWMQLSDSDSYSRGLSLIFGLSLIPIYYAIGNLIAGRFTGMCVAAMAAFSYGCILESYLLRNYSCFLCFLSLSFYWMLRWRAQPERKALIYYGIFGLLACLTHFSGIVALFTMTLTVAATLLRGDRGRLMPWLLANAAVAIVAAPVYEFWKPAIAYYQSGAGAPEILMTTKVLIRALLSPMLMFPYLLPYRGGNAYALGLYVAIIVLVAKATGKGSGLHFLLWLMLAGFLIQGALYMSGTYHIRNLIPGPRNSLWLMPMVVPVLGAALASFVKDKKSQQIAAGALILAGALIYDPRARFLDAEYMIKQPDYAALTEYLGTLGLGDVLVTDRMTGFLLAPKPFNAYGAMDNAAWTDGVNPKVIPYGKATMLFDNTHPRFLKPEDVAELYQNTQAAKILNKAGRLIFVNLSWTSPMLEKLTDCKAADVTVVNFPKEEAAKSTSLIVMSKDAYERDLLTKNGAPSPCFK